MSWNRLGTWPLSIVLCLLLSACAWHGRAAEGNARCVHVVFIWLKAPGDAAQIEQLITATRRLAEIPGVREVRVGTALPSDRPVVDDSFDVGLYMTFDTPEALASYQRHPVHQAAVRDTLAPLADHYRIYDFIDVGGERRR